jgi:putative ABC transport system substrate-binding protein
MKKVRGRSVEGRVKGAENVKTKITVLTLSAMLFALCVSAEAQPKTVFRIGYLSASDPVTDPRIEGTRQSLRELGYIEGQNITIEYRNSEGKLDRVAAFAAEMVRLKVDIIVASGGTSQVRAVMNATKTIPIVMAGQGSDPVAAGLIDSLARPGGNVTGLTSLTPELGGKRLELLKEAVPKLARVAVLYDPASPPNVLLVKEYLPPAARALKLTLQPWELRAADDLDRVFAAMGKQRPDGLYVTGGALLTANVKRIAGLVLKSRFPSMCTVRTCAEVGGLMSYAADLAENTRLVAWYVDKILKGAKPADLPVQQPTKFEFVINLQTAKQIGVTIPPDVLARATKIIR